MSTHSLTRTYQNTWPVTTNEDTLRLKAPASIVNESGLKITQVLADGHSSFGAEVEGIDWSQSIPDHLASEVSGLMNFMSKTPCNTSV
jgi:hypothetical protein